MVDRSRQLSVADATLIRHALTFYEERITACQRYAEQPEVTLAVVQTLETLRRVYLLLSNGIRMVDDDLSKKNAERDDLDDIPF